MTSRLLDLFCERPGANQHVSFLNHDPPYQSDLKRAYNKSMRSPSFMEAPTDSQNEGPRRLNVLPKLYESTASRKKGNFMMSLNVGGAGATDQLAPCWVWN